MSDCGYMNALINDRLPSMLLDITRLIAVEHSIDLSGTVVHKSFKAAVEPPAWLIIPGDTERVPDTRTAANTILVRRTLLLRWLIRPVEAGFFDRYPMLFWTAPEMIMDYFHARGGFSTHDDQDMLPCILPNATSIQSVVVFGDMPSSTSAAIGMDCTLSISTRRIISPVYDNN